MKKIKLLAPILGAISTIGVTTPILTSCNKNTNVNKVVLQKNQITERTVTSNSGTLAFYFKQENPSSPEKTQVYVNDFAINGVSGLKAPHSTIKYVADSGGNMRVTIDVKSIVASWSNVETIGITLTFINQEAGTNYTFEPLTINVVSKDEAESGDKKAEDVPAAEDQPTAEVDFAPAGERIPLDYTSCESSFNNNSRLYTFNLPKDENGNQIYPADIGVIKLVSPYEALTEGYDYFIYLSDNGATINIWLPSNTFGIKISVEGSTDSTVAQPRLNNIPFALVINGTECDWDNNVVKLYKDDFKYSSPTLEAISALSTSETIKECSFEVNGLYMSNSDDYTEAKYNETSYEGLNKCLMEAFYSMRNDNCDQNSSVVLVKYDVTTNDGTNDKNYYGSCAFKIYPIETNAENIGK